MAPSCRMAVRAASLGVVLRGFVSREKVEGDAAAAAAGATGGVDWILGDDGDVEAGEGLGVRGVGAVGGGDEDAAELVVDGDADLGDARIVVAGSFVGALDEGELVGDLGVGGDAGDGVERGGADLVEALHALGLGAVGDQRCGACGFQEAIGAEVVGVGVAGALAGENANAAADADALGGGLDDAFVHAEGGRGDSLEVKVGELSTGRKGFSKTAFQKPLGEAEMGQEVTLMVRDVGMVKVGGGCHLSNCSLITLETPPPT